MRMLHFLFLNTFFYFYIRYDNDKLSSQGRLPFRCLRILCRCASTSHDHNTRSRFLDNNVREVLPSILLDLSIECLCPIKHTEFSDYLVSRRQFVYCLRTKELRKFFSHQQNIIFGNSL